MPNPTNRPSLNKDLASRYATQRAGGAFEVKQRLGAPGTAPRTGDRMPVDGNEVLYTKDDFAVKQIIGQTEFLDTQDANNSSSPRSKELSRYIKGFSSRKYKP